MSLLKYFQILRDKGADIVREIKPSDIVTAAWPIMKCRYGCPNFGHNRSCPPFAPAYDETRRIIDCYSCAILFSVHDMDAGTPAALACMQALIADGYYKAIAFGTGPCRRCEKCIPADCPHSSEVMPSPEACGIDLVATVRNAGLPIDMPPKPGAVLNCYGLLLVE